MFESEKTMVVIKEKLLPALEEVAMEEFGLYSLNGNVDQESEKWMNEQKMKIILIAENYLEGLKDDHVRIGKLIGELESFGQELGGNGDDVGDGSQSGGS